MQEGTNSIAGHLRVTGDVFDADCPTRKLLDRVGDKWSTLLLLLLWDGPMRYGQLKRGIAGISPKMLSQTLRSHERDGLISRTVTAGRQIEVTYTITALGRTLLVALRPLIDWAEGHMHIVGDNQLRYDREGDSGVARDKSSAANA